MVDFPTLCPYLRVELVSTVVITQVIISVYRGAVLVS